MSGEKTATRGPVVAGMFYPQAPAQCRQEVGQFFDGAMAPVAGRWVGALVPHAGWICSGQVAADAIVSLKAASPSPDLIVVFGAVHTVGGIDYGALDDHDQWQLPTGNVPIARALEQRLLQLAPSLRVDGRLHRREHAIEVNLPLLQHAWPATPVLPIEVPPTRNATRVGQETAAALRQMSVRAVFLASSDLTHYGPDYGMTHAGEGRQALDWATENDRALLRKIQQLRAEEIVEETERNGSACGGGAIAAMLAACQEMGATQAQLLRHTNSVEVLSRAIGRGRIDSFVGYAAMVVG